MSRTSHAPRTIEKRDEERKVAVMQKIRATKWYQDLVIRAVLDKLRPVDWGWAE